MIKNFLVALSAICTIGQSVAIAQQSTSAAAVVAPTGKVEPVGTGFAFTEGPAWDPASQTLYFTDIPNNSIHRVASDGTVSLLTDQSAHTNGLLVTTDGRLLGCQMDGKLVQYSKADATAEVLADQFGGKRFNAPNDLIIDGSGGVYFTDPLFRAPRPLPQTIQAVYYRSTDGEVSRVTEGIAAPNGIALSPDGKQLYVAPSKQAEMLVYDVAGPGKLSGGRVFCELTQPDGMQGTGGDGMVVDVNGNLYFTTHLGVEIFSPSGEKRGLVSFPQQPANVTFMGADRKTMVVTARTGVYKIAMPIAGLPPN